MKDTFELQRDQIEIDRDLEIDDNEEDSIIAYIETYFDVDKKFGTNTKDDDTAWVNFYARYNVSTGKLTTFYFVESDDDTDFHYYEPTKNEENLIINIIREKCLETHDCTVEEFVK